MSIARRGGVDNVILISGGAGNPGIYAGTADPTAGGGLVAAEGSFYLRYGAAAGRLYRKTGVGNTAWNQLPVLDSTNTFTGAQGSALQVLTDAAPIVTNAALGNMFRVVLTVLGGNTRLLQNPTGLVSGFTYQWKIIQPAVGATQAMTFDAKFKFPSAAGVPGLTPTNSAVDIITASYDGVDDTLDCVFQPDFV